MIASRQTSDRRRADVWPTSGTATHCLTSSRAKCDRLPSVIRLNVPAALRYRDLAIRAVAAACKLVGSDSGVRGRDAFDDEVISAFSEAFNNAALHCSQPAKGLLEIDIEVANDGITIELRDRGEGFDLASVPEPDFDALPESGMGIFIMRAMMDEVHYRLGDGEQPNVLVLRKRYPRVVPAGLPQGVGPA
jgi:serine/threonine-protein kinase RsbW